jgi:thiol-disulfide isomerase/thioredoxin
MKIFFSVLIIVSIIFLPANLILNAKSAGIKAPGIALEDTDGSITMLSSLLSKNNIILSFWSYDCAPCRKEMPELQKMADSGVFSRKNMKLVFVYVEAATEKTNVEKSGGSPKEKAVEVLQKLKIKETCLLDIYGVVFNNYRQANNIIKPTMPLLFIVNRKKDIIFSEIGYNENNLLRLEEAVKNDL